MAIPAVAAPAIVVLKRRRIGALAVLFGVITVAVGYVLPMTSALTVESATTRLPLTVTVPAIKTPVVTVPSTNGSGLALPAATGSALDIARHAFDHPPLNSGNLGSMVVDIATRAGVVIIAAAALLCIVFNVLPLMRGLVGVAAGLGLMGTAIELGVVLGERSRVLTMCATSIGRDCHIDPQGGIWMIAGGFVLALVGGAVGALRPLAGLIGGLSFAFSGALLGAGVAWLVTQQHVLDVGGRAVQSLGH